MRNGFISMVAVLALSACGGAPEQPDEAAVNAAPVAATPAPEPRPSEGAALVPTPVPTPPAPLPAATEAPAGTIPEAVRGRWGLVPADCTSTRGDAKGLLTITADTLRFYESRGTLGSVAERDDSRIVADFAMSGEGQTWTRRMVLDAQDDGQTLIRREYGADAMPGVLRYRRCG